jgi:ribose transport system substrate-binding protein
MKRTILLVTSLLLIAALLLPACQPAEAPGEEGAGEMVDTSDEEYIYVSAMGNLEFFNAHKYGWAWAGEQLGVNATYVGPAEYDISIEKAVEAGIPVTTILGDLPKTSRLSFIGSRQFDLGYTGGKAIAEALNGDGEVAILSIPGVQMFDDREEGYRAAFDEYPGIEVIGVGDTKADTVTSINVAKDMMLANPDLAAFVGTDSTGGIGAATAVEEAGRVGEVLAVAMDRNSDVLQKIKDGTLTGTVAQDDAAMAFWCLQVLYNWNHNQAPLTTDNAAAGVFTGPTNLNTWVNYIDESNVDYFLEANEIYAQD